MGYQNLNSSVAQLIEHPTVNRSVVGLNPTRGANFKSGDLGSIPNRDTCITASNCESR